MSNKMNSDVRLTKVETEIGLLAESQKNLSNTVNKYIEQSDKNQQLTHAKIDEVAREVSKSGKTNWTNVTAIVGVIVICLGWYMRSETASLASKEEIAELQGRVRVMEKVQDLEEKGFIKYH